MSDRGSARCNPTGPSCAKKLDYINGKQKNDFRGEEKESPTPEDPELWLSCEILNVGHWNGSVRRSGLCWLDLC